MGIKRRKSSKDEWLQLAVKQSGYTEDEMRDNDIRSAYLVSYPDVVNTGKAIKTIQRMNLAVFFNRWTFSRIQAKPEVARRLQAMLLEKNPEINTAGGRVLSGQEYDDMEKEYIEKRKCINNGKPEKQ